MANEGPRSFAVFLNQVAEGDAVIQISAEMHDMLKRLRDRTLDRNEELTGELNLKFKFAAHPRGEVHVTYDVATKVPQAKGHPSSMWITKGGNVTPENPRQQKLPLREAPPPARKMREPEHLREDLEG